MQRPVAKDREFDTSLVLAVGYLFIQMMSDLTVAKFIALTPSISIAVGSLLYPISFTWIDLVNDHLGKARARKLVNATIVTNILMVSWFRFYVVVPGASWWTQNPFPQQAISYALGGLWRVIVASVVTEFVSEHADITVFHFVRQRYPALPRWARSLISNLISAPLDGTLFAFLAFYGNISFAELWSVILGSVMYKLCVGIVAIPLIYLTRARPEQQIA